MDFNAEVLKNESFEIAKENILDQGKKRSHV